jgi:hypothetical protein
LARKLGGIVGEEEDKEFQALGDRLLHNIAELDEEDILKAERQEFRRFETEQEVARMMMFEQDRQCLKDEK